MHKLVIRYDKGIYTPLTFDGFGIGDTEYAALSKDYDSDYSLLKNLISLIIGKPAPKYGGSSIYRVLESWYNVQVYIKCNKKDIDNKVFDYYNAAGLIEDN